MKAIKTKYPEMILIANQWAGGHPEQPLPAIIDEHYYNTPEWFIRNANHYDNYDRKGPKVFVGEYAVTKNTGNGNLRGAISEAAFMTGLERNSDVVAMAAYAPLFCNANHKRWPINLINFDSSRWFGIPSYHVQKMFAENRGTVTLPVTIDAPAAAEPPPSGRIGVGTWKTSAEYKDLMVTAPDGKLLFAGDFSENTHGWKLLGRGGEWSAKDGVLRQTSHGEFIRALAGDRSWTDYTLSLKARKISGDEGFLIIFHNQEDDDRIWWNLGGFGNTRHAIEPEIREESKDGRIETGRWYDIKVDVRGTSVKCHLDGMLVQQSNHPPRQSQSLFASATRDAMTGEIIVKVVNVSAHPVTTEIDLKGTGPLSRAGKAIVLTSDSPKDENSLDDPVKVSPKTESLEPAGGKWIRSFPGNSLTILRMASGLPRP